jgi:hypothetical protein
MANPVRVAQSFALVPTNALPQFNGSTGPPGVATESGESTTNTDPPRFAIPSPTNWANRGTAFVQPLGQSLHNQFICSREECIYHANEGDVVRAAALYLLHPVNQALCAHQILAGTINCQSEYTANRVRSDITYYKTPPASNGTSRAFAVVEFKKRGIIRQQEFQAAQKVLNPGQGHDTNYYTQAATNRDYGTFYTGSSRILMKQAGSYATRQRTQYVALFDWDVLVLVRFIEMDPELDVEDLVVNGVGDWCETTIITRSHEMRAALLGFLASAYQDTPP